MLIGTRPLALSFEIAHLGQIGDTTGSPEEAHRLDLHPHTAAVFVNIERGSRIAPVPEGVPCLIALCGVECATFLVVALGRGEIEAFTDTDVVGQEIARYGLLESCGAGINR